MGEEEKISGALAVFFDAPQDDEVRRWLFQDHAEEVLESMPGATATTTYRILNPMRPGQQEWLTIVETSDLIRTWKYRAFETKVSQSEATRRGVTNRFELFTQLTNKRMKGS